MFEEFTRNAITDRYDIMCYIDAQEKHQPSYFDDGISGGGNALRSNSTTAALFSLSVTVDLNDCWLQGLEKNYIEHSNIYFENMKNMKTPVELSKPLSHKKKLQSLLHAIGSDWYMNKFNYKLPPLNKQKLSKKAQLKENKIKRNLQMENKNWND